MHGSSPHDALDASWHARSPGGTIPRGSAASVMRGSSAVISGNRIGEHTRRLTKSTAACCSRRNATSTMFCSPAKPPAAPRESPEGLGRRGAGIGARLEGRCQPAARAAVPLDDEPAAGAARCKEAHPNAHLKRVMSIWAVYRLASVGVRLACFARRWARRRSSEGRCQRKYATGRGRRSRRGARGTRDGGRAQRSSSRRGRAGRGDGTRRFG